MMTRYKYYNRRIETFVGSLDVAFLFTETINICPNTLFENKTKESHFIFNRKLYKQVDEVAMCSPLGGSTLANTFLAYFDKEDWLRNCSSDFKPHYYRRYVDDKFCFIHLTRRFRSLPEIF